MLRVISQFIVSKHTKNSNRGFNKCKIFHIDIPKASDYLFKKFSSFTDIPVPQKLL